MSDPEGLAREQLRLAASIGRHLGPRQPVFTPAEVWYSVTISLAVVGAALLGAM